MAKKSKNKKPVKREESDSEYLELAKFLMNNTPSKRRKKASEEENTETTEEREMAKKKTLYQKYCDGDKLSGAEVVTLYGRVNTCIISLELLEDPDLNLALFKLRFERESLTTLMHRKKR